MNCFTSQFHNNKANTNAKQKQITDPTFKGGTRLDEDPLERPAITADRAPLLILIFPAKEAPVSLSARRCSAPLSIFRRRIPVKESESSPRSAADEIVRDSESKRRAIRAIGTKSLIAAICVGQIQFELPSLSEENQRMEIQSVIAWIYIISDSKEDEDDMVFNFGAF